MSDPRAYATGALLLLQHSRDASQDVRIRVDDAWFRVRRAPDGRLRVSGDGLDDSAVEGAEEALDAMLGPAGRLREVQLPRARMEFILPEADSMLPVAAIGAAAALIANTTARENLEAPAASAPIGEFFASAATGITTAAGKRVALKGVNWSGFETDTYSPHGIWSVSMESLLDFLQKNKFNALRVPFSCELALGLDTIQAKAINASANPSLPAGTTAGKVLDKLVAECKKRGILVMLDMHRLKATDGISELWYSPEYPEAKVIQGWEAIAKRYKNEPTVFAADVKNEPHGAAVWGGTDPKVDWASAAERIGNAILKVNPKLLIFVEGVDRTEPGAPQPGSGWWGGVVTGALRRPIKLSNPRKLVLSPHVYGPSVHAQPYFTDPTFENCVKYWDHHFGDALRKGAGWLCVGEWGGWADDSKTKGGPGDAAWQARLAKYIAGLKIDSFYWCLNPNSGDTGGLLGDDWVTPQTAKLAFVAAAHPTPTKFK